MLESHESEAGLTAATRYLPSCPGTAQPVNSEGWLVGRSRSEMRRTVRLVSTRTYLRYYSATLVIGPQKSGHQQGFPLSTGRFSATSYLATSEF